MSINFVEELVSEYYRLRGYMVTSNYWFPIQTERTRTQRGKSQTYMARSWSDMDVIAIGEKEILIVQVKAIVNEMRVVENIKTFFKQAGEFLQEGMAPDRSSSISWWLKGRQVKHVLVYEYYSPPSYLDELKACEIEVWKFNDYFEEILEYIVEKDGVKEGSPLMRMLHYLNINNKLVQEEQ